MKKGYLINNKIEFWPGNNLLVLHKDNLVNYRLTGPASRCFLALLQKTPEIVPQNDIYKIVWEDEGMLVPPNTLYQNIAAIRRGLKTLSQDDNIIVTIPKKGFQIPSNNTIKEITIHDIVIPEGHIPQNINPENTWGVKSIIKNNACYLIAVLVFSIISIGYMTSFDEGYGSDYFSSYEIVGKRNGCIFYHNKNKTDIDWEKEINSIGMDLKCHTFPWVYMTFYENTPSKSIIRCNNSIQNENVSCISTLYREVKDEKR